MWSGKSVLQENSGGCEAATSSVWDVASSKLVAGRAPARGKVFLEENSGGCGRSVAKNSNGCGAAALMV